MTGLPLDGFSLLGRRVEVDGLVSQKGQLLNGQIGSVIEQLEAGRWGVRLERGDKSIHQSNLYVRQLHRAEMVHHSLEWHVRKWPAEVVAFFKAHCREEYIGSDPDVVALKMDRDENYEAYWDNPPRFSPYLCVRDLSPQEFGTLLRYGLSLDGMLKVALRHVAGIDSNFLHALDKDGDGGFGGREITCLLHAAKAADRELNLLSSLDSIDLLRAVLAADRVPFKCLMSDELLPRSREVLPPLRDLAAALFRCGIPVRGLAEEAKTKFQDICSDPSTQTEVFHVPELTWLRDQLDQERFNARIEKWCKWEEMQWCLIFRTFWKQGLGLPGAAASMIADCVAGWQPLASDWSARVLQDVDHNEPVPHIDEEVAHTAAQLEADEAWAQQVELRISEGELPKENANGQDDTMWMETETSEAGSELEAWGVGGKARPSDFGDRVYIMGFTRSGAALKRALQEGRELEPVRCEAAKHGQNCLLQSGASIFVYPDQYLPILSVVTPCSLKPHHVVVSEAYLPLVEQAVNKLPSRANVRPNLLETTALIDGDNPEYICYVEKTFLKVTPSQHRELDSVTQSTSQAHGVKNVRGH